MKARGFPLIGAALLFAGLVGAGLVFETIQGGSAAERLVTAMFINAIIVVGIQIYIGNTGVFSFGHIGFAAIAGYAFALFAIDPSDKAGRIADAPFGLADVSASVPVSVLVAVVVSLIVAAIVGVGLARSGAQSGAIAATVITLALLFVTHEVARSWSDVTGGERAGLTFGIGETLDGRVAVYAALFGSLAIALLFARSGPGRLAKAGREDALAARAMGIDPRVQQTIALLLSVAVVAVGASLRVYEVGSIQPGQFFFDYTLLTLVMLVVGGRNSVTGAVVGVVTITLVRELARRLGSDGFEVFGLGLDGAPLDWVFREGLPRVVLGLAMVGFMIWRSKGLIDDWELDEWLRRRFGGDRDAPRPARDEAAAQNGSARPVDHQLLARDVTVDFGGFRALNGARMAASNGEVVGLIGPNGAGKTTLVNVITGMVPPTSGTVALSGNGGNGGNGTIDLTGAPPYKVARSGLVRTFQNLRLFSSLTVLENVEVSKLVADSHRPGSGDVTVEQLVAAAGLWDHRDRRASELDYGNSRRLELARAAAMDPTFLLLDEPTSGMSDSESLEMVEHVRGMADLVGAGVLVIDHDLQFIVGICDRVYCLDQGAVIAEGTPDEIQNDPAVQAAYLGTATVES